MQNAKDTFYLTLRGRLAALNPARTMLLRSVSRPGILVEEAEPAMPTPLSDAFFLRWTGFAIEAPCPVLCARLTCEIRYSTAGSQSRAGLDRGRALEEMDYELMKILYPFSAQKMNYAVTPAAAMSSRVFWSEPQFGAQEPVRDR